MALVSLPRQLVVDANGTPRSGARAYFYQSGSTTPITVYTTAAYAVPHAQPVEATASGLFPAVYVNPSVNQTYKIIVRTASDVDVYSEDNIPAQDIAQADVGRLLYPTTSAETAAGVAPTNNIYPPGVPERYGAVGDGATSDQSAVAACFAANDDIYPSAGKTYLIDGITINRVGIKINGPVGGNAAYFKISGGAGTFGLKFVHASGNSTHFSTGFVGSNFNISCAPTANKIRGIWADNAEIQYLENVTVDLTGNSYAGAARDATYALLGIYQQDGVFQKCTFCSGAGANADGVYLDSINADSLPNSNLFIGCRSQSNGGYGVRQERGVGNMWVGGKLQANTLGGWLEANDGSGNGGVGTCLYGVGFEHNGTAGVGYDLHIELGRKMAVRDCSFQSLNSENQYGIYAEFAQQCVFDNNFSYDTNPVNFVAGSGNIWNPRTNHGFGTVTIAAGVVLIPTGVSVTKSSTQSTTNNAFTTLTFDTEEFDSDSMHSTVTNTSRLTAPSFGLYQCNFSVRWATNNVGTRIAQVLKNGVTAVASSENIGADNLGSSDAQVNATTVLQLVAGDYVELQSFQDSGGALNVQNGQPTRFQLIRIPE